MIGRNGERGSGISALAARHDDDDVNETLQKDTFALYMSIICLNYKLLISIAVHAFVSRVSMSFSVDESLLPRQVNLSTSFREVPSSVEMSPVWL